MLEPKREPKDILVIFDCDGVLIDSEAITSRIEYQALRNSGCLLSMEDYLDRSLGVTEEDLLWENIAAEWDVALPDDFGESLRDLICEALAEELLPIKGVREALDSLPYESCVASGATPERLRLTLGVTGLAERFAGKCFSGAMVARGKPAPDVFLLAAERMGFEPGDCIVVEDSINGVRAAISAGMTVLGFTGASHCPPGLGGRLRELGCRDIFSEMENLTTLIEGNMKA
jgi:HAD superfamily hydrolase (TIGR01509 family)